MDGRLVERARAGDADAFYELVRRSVDRVYRTAVGILGNPADAKDATQEALIGAWRALPTLRDVDRFDAWLARITVNACRMAIRRRRGVRELTLTPDEDDRPTREPAAPEVDRSARSFDSAFDRLPVD